MRDKGLPRTDTLLIQFAKEPVPGEVKTRMMPQLSAQQACDLHSQLLWWTCNVLCQSQLGAVELWMGGSASAEIAQRAGQLGVTELREQVGADLGARMCNALEDGLSRFRQVLLVGSDCPSIDANYLRSALDGLRSCPVVFGPALDGGYVLVGATRLIPEMFEGIAWGQSQVLADSLSRLDAAGARYQTLAALADIDTPADLPVWRALCQAREV